MRILSVAVGLATLLACNGGTTVPGPGGGTTLVAADLVAGDLVITEFIADAIDPDCLDAEGEWVEIYNNAGAAVNLQGVRMRDGQGNSTTLPSLVVANGAYALLGKGPSTSWCEVEASPDGFYGSSFWINNTGNETLSITTPAGALIDAIPTFVDLGTVWGSIALDDRYIDANLNDDGDNWYYTNTCTGLEPYGTPGEPNLVCPF
jgi:hypothetical protein